MATYSVLEVYLSALFVNENGAFGDAAAANLLTAVLVYPRPGISDVTTVKALALEDATLHDFSERPFPDRVLFKERIYGPTAMELRLTCRLPARRIPELVEELVVGAVEPALGLFTGGVGNALLAAGTRSVDRSIQRHARREADREEALVIGSGRIGVTPAALKEEREANGGPAVRKVRLIAPETVTLSRTAARLERDEARSTRLTDRYRATRETVTLDAGDEVGWINLELELR